MVLATKTFRERKREKYREIEAEIITETSNCTTEETSVQHKEMKFIYKKKKRKKKRKYRKYESFLSFPQIICEQTRGNSRRGEENEN